MVILRRRAREIAGGMWAGHVAAPPWMQPLPNGPVTFDPSLRTAGELVGQGPVAAAVERPPAGSPTVLEHPTALDRRRPSARPGAPEPPLHPRGHAA